MRVVSLCNSLIEDSEVALDQVKDNLLGNRVRSFSYAKDVTKFALKKKKNKSLRKDIKKAMEKPAIE